MIRPLQYRRLASQPQLYRLPAIVLVLLFGFSVRVFDLEHMPPFVQWDEVNQAHQPLQILSGEVPLLGVGYNDNPNLTFFEHTPYLLFGGSLWALRLTSAFWSVLVLAVVYFGVRPMYGARAALISTLLMAGAHLLIHYGRVAVNVLPAVLTTFLSLGLLVRAQREHRASVRADGLYLAAGIAVALNLYAYVAARAVLVGVSALWLLAIPRRPEAWRAYRHNAFRFATGLAVTALPIVWWYIQHPESLTSRAQTLNIFGSWAVHINAERYGQVSTTTLVLLQTLRSLGGFAVAWDTSPNYHVDAALVDAGTTILLLPAIVVAWRRESRVTAALLLTLLCGLIAGAILTIEPPSSPHYIVLVPIVITWVAVCLDRLCLSPASRPLVPLIMAGILVLNLSMYFDYYPEHGAPLTLESGIGYAVHASGGCCLVWYLGELEETPRQIADFVAAPTHITYIADVDELAREAEPAFAAHEAAMILVPEVSSAEVLPRLQQLLPGGNVEAYVDRGETMFRVYWLNGPNPGTLQ